MYAVHVLMFTQLITFDNALCIQIVSFKKEYMHVVNVFSTVIPATKEFQINVDSKLHTLVDPSSQ